MPPENADLKRRIDSIAKRWQVTLGQPLLLKRDRVVYKVETESGPAVLKVCTKFGNEAGAVPFLRGLPDGIGVRIRRATPLRRAILMDWLEGPNLEELYDQGREAEAELHLAKVAAALKQCSFRYPFILPRIAKRIGHRLKRCKESAERSDTADLYGRTVRLFDTLNQTTEKEGVIHGDLHFCNVILTSDGPRLIDPKGYRADPAMDLARALTGPGFSATADEYCKLITRRAAFFGTQMGESPLRIIQWGAVIRAVRLFDDARRSAGEREIDPYLAAFLDLAQA